MSISLEQNGKFNNQHQVCEAACSLCSCLGETVQAFEFLPGTHLCPGGVGPRSCRKGKVLLWERTRRSNSFLLAGAGEEEEGRERKACSLGPTLPSS